MYRTLVQLRGHVPPNGSTAVTQLYRVIGVMPVIDSFRLRGSRLRPSGSCDARTWSSHAMSSWLKKQVKCRVMARKRMWDEGKVAGRV